MSTKKYFPLHVHSHYSLLDGLGKPKDIAKRCEEIGCDGSALTDHGSVAGAVSFHSALTKKDLKPILGVEFYVCHEPPANRSLRKLTHMVILAKSHVGWKKLIGLTSSANSPGNFYYKPRLDLDSIADFTTNHQLVAFSGHLGSCISNCILDSDNPYYSTQPQKSVRSDCLELATKKALQLQGIFGKGNFFLEVQLIDNKNIPVAKILADIIRQVSQKTGIPCIATPDAHYVRKEDAIDQRVLLCTSMDMTLQDVNRKMIKNEDVGLSAFFRSSNYHIPTYQEMIDCGNTEEELENTLLLAETCQSYQLTAPPCLPKYKCPDNMSSTEHMHQLCREGWVKRLDKIKRVIAEQPHITIDTYADRFKSELAILDEANLADYFLIVRDIVKYAMDNDQLVGCGRGSAAGSLVLYLLNVTHIDPIEYDLLFSRFYNAGRNTAERVSLPDVDMDFEIGKRGDIIKYIKQRFGENKVSQMLTFTRMQGRSALKDVLRVRGACSAVVMNEITSHIPDEAEISDQLQIMKEVDLKQGGDGDASIIQWALENHADDLKQWAYLDDDGNIQGEMGKMFEQAIRLEGTKRSQSKHAAGVVISSTPLVDTCPMVYDKTTGEMIAGMEMNDLESIGMVKFDCLGIAMLDKIHGVVNLLYKGTLH